MEKEPFAKTFWADYSAFDEKKLIENLSKMDEARAARIARAARTETKCELLASGLIVREALLRVFGIENPTFTVGEYGKPELVDHPDVYFNLSHSKGTVACTVSNVPCGLDIEYIEQPKHMEQIVNQFFSNFERGAILLSAEPAEAFLRLWTLRESYVKMRGTGFATGLSTLSCSFPGGEARISESGVAQEDASFIEMRNIYGWRTAICTKGKVKHTCEKIEL